MIPKLFINILAPSIFCLAGCGEFLAAVDRGASRQQEYMERQRDPFGAHVADLPTMPERVANIPARTFYRCRSLDYAFDGAEWYHRRVGEGSWQPGGCGAGEYKTTSRSYSRSFCGSNFHSFWKITSSFSDYGQVNYHSVQQKIDQIRLVHLYKDKNEENASAVETKCVLYRTRSETMVPQAGKADD